MAAIVVPIQLQIITALQELLRDNLNDLLTATGEEPLADSAFAPVTPTYGLVGDTVAVSYAGALRPTRDDRNDKLRLLETHRDSLIAVVVSIFAYAASDQAAQARAIALEYAVVSLLDDRAHRYLGGLIDQPVLVGTTVADYGEDQDRSAMYWELQIPLTLRVRTTRPE